MKKLFPILGLVLLATLVLSCSGGSSSKSAAGPTNTNGQGLSGDTLAIRVTSLQNELVPGTTGDFARAIVNLDIINLGKEPVPFDEIRVVFLDGGWEVSTTRLAFEPEDNVQYFWYPGDPMPQIGPASKMISLGGGRGIKARVVSGNDFVLDKTPGFKELEISVLNTGKPLIKVTFDAITKEGTP